jgi:hypothetical protein
LREDDLALSARQKICIEDFLSRGANIGTRYGVVGRTVAVDLRRGRVWGVTVTSHVAWPWRRFGRGIAVIAVLTVFGRMFTAMFVAQEGRKTAFAVAVSVSARTLFGGVSFKVIQSLGRALASSPFLEFGRSYKNRAA